MKTNIRNIALVATMVSAVSMANAQSFELRAGAGATLVGNTFVCAPGASFTVELWLNNGGATPLINNYSAALAYDRTSGSGTTATKMDNKLDITSYTNSDASFTSGLNVNVKRAAATTTGTGTNYGFAGGATRPYVSFSSFGMTTGTSQAGFSGRLGSFVVNASALANGETYGDDANEAGLFLANQGGTGGPSLGGSGWVGAASADSKRFGSVKYAVQAVPEPGTMIAVAAGLAALARRRKK